MPVAQLWRYPVKSLQGELLHTAVIDREGLEGDRRWAIFDADTGFGLTARRAPELLFASARLGEEGGPEITLPDGSFAAGDAELSAWLGRSVSLRSTADEIDRRYENPSDFEHETTAAWEPFNGANGAFHDSAGAKVSIVSARTIGEWQPRRFRANVLLTTDTDTTETDSEDSLVGSRIALGGALLEVGMRIERCVMVTRPQPGGVDRDLDVLRTIHRDRQGCLAVGATVARPGRVSVGDRVEPA